MTMKVQKVEMKTLEAQVSDSLKNLPKRPDRTGHQTLTLLMGGKEERRRSRWGQWKRFIQALLFVNSRDGELKGR